MITLKSKMFWKIFGIIFSLVIGNTIISELNNGDITLAGVIIRVFMLFILLISAFSALTIIMQVDENGLKVRANIFSKYKSFKNVPYILLWNKVERISSGFFPLWFPGKMILLHYTLPSGHSTFVLLGSVYANFKEAALFIEKQVSPDIIDDDVKRLFAKYKKRNKTVG